MTLVLLGSAPQVNRLAGCVVHYEDLLRSEQPRQFYDASSVEWEALSYTIDNKYYSANIDIRLLSTSSALPSQLEFEGVIVLAPSKEEFASESIAALTSGGDERLRLLVHVCEGAADPENIEHFTMFAVDNGFEFIEIDSNALTADFDAREKFGLPRLMEALQSHMWSTMKRKPKPSSSGPSAAVSVPEGPSRAEASIAPADRPPPAVAAVRDTDSTPASEGLPLPPNPFANEDGEFVGMEDLIQTMMQAKMMREEVAKGNLSDEERRSQAAHFALKLMEMLNLEDEEEDPEE